MVEKKIINNSPTKIKIMNAVKPMLMLLSIFYAFSVNGQSNKADSMAKKHEEMMKIIMTKPKLPVKTIGILLYDGYQTLDAMGPYETLSQLSGVRVFFVAKTKGMISNQKGMKVQVDSTIDKVAHLDILVIPGGAVETFKMSQDTSVLNWIRKIDQTSIYTTSVCTGAWILGATGLLNGKNATTNWYRAEEMLKSYGAHFIQDRWVRDGKYWTSAGVTAGLDMSLAIINELMGEKYTQGVMLNLEYDPKPPFDAGSVKKTMPIVSDMMKEMYDMSMLPLIQKQISKQK